MTARPDSLSPVHTPAQSPDPWNGQASQSELRHGAPPRQAPTWSSVREALGVVVFPANLKRTLTIALVVGSMLVAINQASVLARGSYAWTEWPRLALNYIVPFCVSNLGVLLASRSRGPSA